jgi:hypothetical protein
MLDRVGVEPFRECHLRGLARDEGGNSADSELKVLMRPLRHGRGLARVVVPSRLALAEVARGSSPARVRRMLLVDRSGPIGHHRGRSSWYD